MSDKIQAYKLEREERMLTLGLGHAGDFLSPLLIKMCRYYNEQAYDSKRWYVICEGDAT